MNELIKKAIVCAFLMLATGIGHSAEQTDGGAGRTADETTAVGRDDPFASGFGVVNSAEQSDIPSIVESVQSKPTLFVRTVTLKFLNAASLKVALDKMSSANGSIGIDDNTNSLIICDTKENLERILAETKKADQTPKQIMIEVVIIDVQLKNDTEIGVDWDILSSENYNFAYRQGMIYPYRLTATTSAADVGNATNYMTTGLGGEFSVISGTVRNVVHLLQEKRNVNILASPRVMVVSGQKAEIKTVEEIPYQEVVSTSGGGQMSSVQFKEVGVTLEVKATLVDDGQILLAVKPKQSVSTGTSGVSDVPIIDTREASTSLLMDDGQVIVMGGLRRQETRKIKSQIPLLGDLPFIGFIFSDDRKIVENSELMVLLSPHVYKGEPVPAEAMARYNQIKDRTLISPPGKPQSRSPDETDK
jgi:type IV pilus assembly protein PilQ